MNVYPAAKRGIAEHGWLHSRFSFSFDQYYNPERMGFGPLRVLNDDTIKAKQGFPMHGHRNMEIITIILKGQLKHKDSNGNSDIISENEIQYMSSGKGIRHSEYNPSTKENTELLQIWIIPNIKNTTPSYQKNKYKLQDGKWTTLVSNQNQNNSIKIKQNAYIIKTKLLKEKSIEHKAQLNNSARLIFLISGRININEHTLKKRDEITITNNNIITINALENSKLILFELELT